MAIWSGNLSEIPSKIYGFPIFSVEKYTEKEFCQKFDVSSNLHLNLFLRPSNSSIMKSMVL